MSAGDVEDIYELSPLQQGILFHSLYDGDSDLYVNQRGFLIEGTLDPDLLERAWQLTSDAHTALRTSFHWEGLDKPLQVVHGAVPVDFHQHDWSGDVAASRTPEERFGDLLVEDLRRGFDLARAPLQRTHLVRFADRRYGFVWTHHLLVLDGWSVPLVLNDVMRRYRGLLLGTSMPEPPPAYRHYIAWLQRQDLDAARAFWLDALGGRPAARRPAPLLPEDPGRHGGQVDERAALVPPALVAALATLSARHRVTLNTVLQAAWALVLQRYTGDGEVTFGVTSSCRPPELPGVERMAGLFTNSLPVRITVPDLGDLGAWLRDVQARYTGVRRHEYSPLAQIKQWTGATGPEPLFHSLVVFDNYSLAVDLGEIGQQVSIRPLDAVEKTSQPLVISATPEPEFTLRLRFHADRLPCGAADEILDSFRRTLEAMAGADRVEAAASIPAPAPPAGRRHPVVRYPDADRTLPALLTRQAGLTPDAVAVVCEDGILSYADLFERADRVAAALRGEGIGPGRVVGVCTERSAELVVALVGTALAGGAYLPLDPSLPSARLAFQIEDAGCRVVLSSQACASVAHACGAARILTLEELPGPVPVGPAPAGPAPAGPVPAGPGPADPAYVMYTSGSTGQPKGVLITQDAIVNRLLWMQETFRLTPEDRVLQKTPFGFDVSVWEFFWPLITGAGLVVARPGGHQDAEYLARTIARQGVSVAHFVPSMLQLFLDEPSAARVRLLRLVVCSGEQLPHRLTRRFAEVLPDVELHNLYGPTEAAVDVTWWDCSRTAPPGVVPIGQAIANVTTYVLDRRLDEVPAGVPGELYLGGVQLARGYVNRAGLTASTFVAHPLAGPGARLYRTGDQVRTLPDGSLEFLGRLDHQVKVHGYRIELGEIEETLAGHPSVGNAAVILRERPDGVHLLAYVTASTHTTPDVQVLREHLRVQLPDYMVPAGITVLPSMPLSANGKLDRAQLLASAPAVPCPVAEPERPATDREQAVATVFAEILGLTEVDVTASFFDLGGNSYDAVRAVRRIDGATVGLFAAHPSVRELADELSGQDRAQRLLLRLTSPGPAARTLVCVPFGGGSAITYQPLARALGPDTALLSLSPPGHELGGDPELRPLEDVAGEAADAVLRTTDGPVCVYGHCAGVALAVEVTRQLEQAGRDVERLFVAASYPFFEPGRSGRLVQRSLSALVGRGLLRVSATTVGLSATGTPRADRAEMRYLQSIGGFDGTVTDDELGFLMRAFRHDVTEAARYFTARWHPKVRPVPLAAPLTFIAGTRDPLTPQYERRHHLWRRFGAGVELATVQDGDHYFHQQYPEAVVKILDERHVAASLARR